MLAHGFSFYPTGRMTHWLPLVWQAHDPSLYPGDIIVEVTARTPGFFWAIMSLLLPSDSGPSIVYTLVPFLNASVFAAGSYFLARAVGAGEGLALLAPLLLSGLSDPLIGANSLLEGVILPASTVSGWLLIAIALSLSRRPIAGFALAGFLGNFHILNAAYAGVLMAAGAAAQIRSQRDALHFAAAGGAALLTVSPTMIQIVSDSAREVPAGWALQIKTLYEIHYHAFSQRWEDLIRFASVMAALGYCAWKDWNTEGPFLAGYTGGYILFFFIAGIAADTLNLTLAVKLQPLRATAWLLPLAIAGLLARLARTDWSEENGRTEGVLLAGFLALLFYYQFARPFMSLPATLMTLYLALLPAMLFAAPRFPHAAPIFRSAALLPAVYFTLLWLLTSLDFVLARIGIVWFWLLDWIPMLSLNGGLAYFLWRNSNASLSPARVAALCGVFAASVILAAISGKAVLKTPDPAWLDVCAWLRENTAKDAVLLAPPRETDLRAFTRRPVYTNMNSEHALYVAPELLPEIARRARTAGIPLQSRYRRPAWTPQISQLRIAMQNGEIDYLLLPAEWEMPQLRSVFANESWQVLTFE